MATKSYLAIFPLIDDMGTVDPVIVKDKPLESKEEEVLWHYNNSRDHDGKHRLRRLPAGTRFEPIY